MFDLLTPNAKTISPMEGSRKGRVYGFDSIEELIEDLNTLDGKAIQSLVVFLRIPSGNKSSTCW